MGMTDEQVRDRLREAKIAKDNAADEYDAAVEAYKERFPMPGTTEHEGFKFTMTKDTTRKTFNKTKFTAVYGQAEYNRFVDEKPQAGSLRITPVQFDDDGGF